MNDIAEKVIKLLHQWQPVDTFPQVAIAQSPAYTLIERDGILIARIKMRAAVPLDYDIPKVDPVTYEFPTGLTMTLACITPGASIFYTINGGLPNPRGTRYADVFAVAPEDVIRARAYLAGYMNSTVMKVSAPPD